SRRPFLEAIPPALAGPPEGAGWGRAPPRRALAARDTLSTLGDPLVQCYWRDQLSRAGCGMSRVRDWLPVALTTLDQPEVQDLGDPVGGLQGDGPLAGEEPAEHRAVDAGVAGQLVDRRAGGGDPLPELVGEVHRGLLTPGHGR